MKTRMVYALLSVLLLLSLLSGCGGSGAKEAISSQDAIEITKEMHARFHTFRFYYVGYPEIAMTLDSSQTIPGHPDMWLVTDERFPTLDALLQEIHTVVTPAFVEKHYPNTFSKMFNTDWTSEEYPLYCAYDGRLYAHGPIGGMGDLCEPDLDNTRIISQDTDTLVVEFDEYLPRYLDNGKTEYEKYAVSSYTLERYTDFWRVDDLNAEII